MDLGKAKLRKVGINNLHCAVHPQHGVLWTDGKGIYLAPIQVEGHQVQNATSVKLGEFDNVVSVHWSYNNRDTEWCHMCVVHQQNVTVWRVSGVLPKLSFKQVRKINVKPVPQGCLWNPTNDVLCLLSRHQCSFYFRHDNNKGSYAFPSLETGKISCGCWSPDGKKLVLCVGPALLIYRWSDVSVCVSEFSATAWKIPGLEGVVTSVSPVLKNSVVVAAEVPLESLCKKHLQEDEIKVSSNGDASEDDIIRPNKSASATHSLMNLQQTQTAPTASSSLTLVQLQDSSREPIKLSSVPLKGVLSPDVLLYEKSSQCVVVGSNTQSQLHIYALLEKVLAYCGDIQLEKGQRPKGLCSMPTYFDDHGAALLILVGQRESEDSSLLTPSTMSEFKLSLKYIILKAGHSHRTKVNGHSDGSKSRSSGALKTASLGKSESMKEHRVKHTSDSNLRGRSGSVKNDHQAIARANSPEKVFKIPISPTEESPLESQELLTGPPADHITHKEKMIEELSDSSDPPNSENLETESAQFSSQPASFNNTKLTTKYELQAMPRHKSKALKERQSSSLPDERRKEERREKDKQGGGILKSSSSKQVQLQSTIGKYPHTEQNSSEASSTVSGVLAKQTNSTENGDASVGQQSSKSEGYQDVKSTGPGSQPDSGRESPHNFPDSNTVSLSSKEEMKYSQTKEEVKCDRSKDEVKYDQTDGNPSPRSNDVDLDQGKEETLSDLGLGSSHHSADSSLDGLDRQVKTQRDSIEALQRRLEELTMTVEETCCVFPTKYQEMAKPEMIEVYCEKPNGPESKRFLLDQGRLQLEPVKLAFGLATVELWLDGFPCVLGANIDGYIPMKFSSDTKLKISGLPADR